MCSTKNLFNAVRKGHYNKTKQILESGVDVESKNEEGWTVLMFAAYYNRIKISKLLIEEYNANINASNNIGRTPLMFAVLEDNYKITKMLLKNDVDINDYDEGGWTALYISTIPTFNALLGHIKIAKLLIKYGADPHYSGYDLETPLENATKLKLYEIMKILINANDLAPLYFVKKT